MRFFSKIVVICNGCFIVAMILRWVETTSREKGNLDRPLKFQPLESTLVILGYSAILVNIVFNIICLAFFLAKKNQPVVKWMIWFNFLLLIGQLFFFFF